MNIKIKNSLILFVIIFLLNSCDNKTIFSEKRETDNQKWAIEDSVSFKASISEPDEFYNIYFDIEVNKNFMTNNLWLFISVESPSGNLQTDTIMYFVADESGKWFGEENRTSVNNKFLYKPAVRFSESGEYTFVLRHGMREKDIPLTESIGLRLEEADFNQR